MLIPFKNLLINKKIKGIIHIGAHELEEMKDYLKKGINRIIWVEANPEKYKYIEKKIQKFNLMDLAKIAAGSKERNTKLNIANNGQSSSILEFGTHAKSYPNIYYTSQISVPEMPIDKWIDINIKDRKNYNFINIDIQGYELEALKGMRKQIKFADYIYLEVNFKEVYKNCCNLEKIDDFLKKFNFHRVGTYRTIKGWGDAIYTKEDVLISKLYYLVLIPIIRLIRIPKKIFIKTFNYINSLN
mgnify:CR=1 FL=1|tara:strand:+ start:253 stop:981 length:729 start_codon:yes stop_codon:yes gene_type:complete